MRRIRRGIAMDERLDNPGDRRLRWARACAAMAEASEAHDWLAWKRAAEEARRAREAYHRNGGIQP